MIDIAVNQTTSAITDSKTHHLAQSERSADLNNREDVISAIKHLMPPGSPVPKDQGVIEKLQALTAKLIQTYQAAGQLGEDPFADVYLRNIHCYEAAAAAKIKDQVVLVTGGEGCVGTRLIAKLEQLGVGKIVSVDFARSDDHTAVATPLIEPGKAFYAVDIRNRAALEQVFAAEKPRFVFHLAAQRLPGLAEKQVRETVSSNLFGTQNVIALCEQYGVETCIFSSTGKASRYTTTEVYAATKKVAEWLFAQAVGRSSTTYGMVRFTHMLDNSSVCQQYDEKVAQGDIVNVHAPNKFLLAQNAGEAVHLLLNSFVTSTPKQLEFVLCCNLGWPVETLEIALYKILRSGKKMPIYFQGSPVGYEEGFFRGQVNWDTPASANMLINAIESVHSRIDASGDFIISPTLPLDNQILDQHLAKVTALMQDPNTANTVIKEALGDCVQAVACSIYAQVAPELLLKVLKWGTEPNYLTLDGTTLDSHRNTIRLIVDSLAANYPAQSDPCRCK